MTLALAGSGLLVLLGVGAFWLAARGAVPDAAADEIAVTVTDSTCEPANLTVPAGRRTFRIHNASDRALEWEILDGVMVVAERENIAPGLNATLTERLVPGTYAITCGLLSNPRGTLTVVPTEASEASRVQPETRAFIGPLSEYRVYLSRRASLLVEATAALRDSIAAGDLEGARSAWRAAREPWRQMAPVSARIADLANSMDPLAEYLAEREQDAAFTGFHRIEYGLWSQNTTEGLAPVADRLAADALTLKDRLRTLEVAPADLAANAAALAGRLADQAGAAQTPYAADDQAEFAAALDGIRKSALLVDPLVIAAQPEASAALHAALEGAQAAIGGYASDPAGRERVAQAFRRVAVAAGALNPAIGLE
ncbi:iron transporter substrate-binding protein [Haematobacter massiliensis]|uniref:Multidrug DMT transporter permease n=1 Tax=Haematobacter massiliensis TaxID=195105 RepID=A0A086Y4R9_9RHOB|nr:iron uptake system protein EfeO [Haematobacter massiliensis]KFI29269.1 multidrug DMT transporter permease [Haematobacter massiliensis]OWJ71982.1 iron transporter substrate-binding protein [Haematobacter massiliensis]OWJ82152.1 iron transporter substrate-binding protein [Haematobacter massiliensis]QBJ25881.1 iron transporter substrate-binding protein [Haematobacter massiliensis]